MYIAKRSEKITAELGLVDESGNIVKTYRVDADPEILLTRYNRARNDLELAKLLVEDDFKPEALEAYGRAIVAMMGVFFSEKDVLEILNFYDGNYTEMVVHILPFIVDELEPKIDEYSKKRIAELKKRRMVAK